MDIVFVVPGIMGSELSLDGEKIWPPPAVKSMSEPERLLNASVAVDDIIREVLLFNIYKELLDPLDSWGYKEKNPGKHGLLVPWPYNWVRGIPETAALLARSIRSRLDRHPGSDVVLLAHSMGGLVCTYALECLEEAGVDPAWRDRVRLLVTFGTPFRGAPEALLNAFGIEGVHGIKASDCQELMADPRFPSAYQLLPHLRSASLWQLHAPLDPLGAYHALAPQGPILGPKNLDLAKAFHSAMENAKPNPATRKFNFCGTTYSTVWGAGQTLVAGDIVDPFRSKSGDGTVPSWSGQQRHDVQFAPLGQKHSTTFGSKDVLLILRDLLRKTTEPPPPGGGGQKLGRRPRPQPSAQPRVSITRNTMSSRRAEVEVEISEPPVDGVLWLGWMPVDNIGTMKELAEMKSRQALTPLVSVRSLPLGEGVEYPAIVTIPRPPGIGEYALMAWSGNEQRHPAELEPRRMDLLWVFDDDDDERSREPSRIDTQELFLAIERRAREVDSQAPATAPKPLQNAQD